MLQTDLQFSGYPVNMKYGERLAIAIAKRELELGREIRRLEIANAEAIHACNKMMAVNLSRA